MCNKNIKEDISSKIGELLRVVLITFESFALEYIRARHKG